jgi:ATP-dependent DNA helicase RecQ
VPPFVVASDRTLREIAEVQPRTVAELLGVYGIGEARRRDTEMGFLAVVARTARGP